MQVCGVDGEMWSGGGWIRVFGAMGCAETEYGWMRNCESNVSNVYHESVSCLAFCA
jgi:hypothetical protein